MQVCIGWLYDLTPSPFRVRIYTVVRCGCNIRNVLNYITSSYPFISAFLIETFMKHEDPTWKT